jgi:YHS domain-containing protein
MTRCAAAREAVGARTLRRAAGLAVLVLIGGCNALVAQNPGSPMRPVNAVRLGDEPRLMLGGRDLVAYFTGAGSVAGRADHRVEYGQVAFLFANADHQVLFKANPQAYLPAYHGYCADGMLGAVPRVADPATYAVIDGRLFLFADADAKARFLRDPAAHVARADDLWRQQVQGRNADWLRLKRWLDPVPAVGAGAMPAAG